FSNALSVANQRLLHFYELPFEWRENPYIIHGYRFYNKNSTCLKSILHLNHNESANIWSHLFGSFFLLYLMLIHFPNKLFQNNFHHINTNLIIAVYVFLLSSLNCLLSSVSWHTFSATTNLNLRQTCACIDYTGITILITCSIISIEIIAFEFHYIKKLLFIISTSLIGFSGLLLNWSPTFDKNENKFLRIGFFCFLAFLGIFSFIIHCFIYGFFRSFVYFLPECKSLIWYLIGIVFYGYLIPEIWRSDIKIGKLLLNENLYQSELAKIQNNLQNHDNNDDKLSFSCCEKKLHETFFKLQPIKTKNHGNFFSLWWVDYIFSSHNFWHLCVLLGIVFHYFALVSMIENLEVSY
ncbi:Izh3p, partial [Ascoidea rubescens DSM 1968]